MKKMLTVLGFALLVGVALIPAGFATPATGITVIWSADSKSVEVTSSKDLSNVVVEDCLGVRYKYDNLDQGGTGTFDHPSGLAITTVWVKSGNNPSGEGPGYGERFDNPDGAACDVTIPCEVTDTCETTTTTTLESTTTTTGETTTTTLATATTVATTTTTLGPDVRGRVLTMPPTPPSDLPKTGSPIGATALVGLLALGLGAVATRCGNKSSP